MIRYRLLLVPALLLAGCGPNRDPIRIGWAGGPLNDSTVSPSLHSAELALEQINQTGGVNGHPLELVVMEDAGEPDSAVRVASRLADSGVVAVIGHIFSSTTLAAAPVYNDPDHPLVAISPSATAPALSAAGPYIFRVCPSDEQYGVALARFARQRLGLSRGAVLYVNNEYGRGIRRTFTQDFVRQGGTLASVDPFLEASPDASLYLERIRQDPTIQFLVVAANITEAAQVIGQVRARGIELPILGGDGLDGIEETGPDAEGVYVSTVYLPTLNTDANRDFLRAYRDRFPLGNSVDYSAAASYDIVYLLKDALSRAGGDRRALREALADIGHGTPAFEGVTGRIAFDAQGDVPSLDIQIGKVEHGVLRPVEGT